MNAWGGKSRSHLLNGKIPGVVCKIKGSVFGENLDCWIAEGWGGGCTRFGSNLVWARFYLPSTKANRESIYISVCIWIKLCKQFWRSALLWQSSALFTRRVLGSPVIILQHLGSAAFTQMLWIPLTDAVAEKPAGHQGSCWCRTKLLCLPGRTAKFCFSWEKIILDTKSVQAKTPTPLITQSDVLHPLPGGDLCPLTHVGNKTSLIECLRYWFTAFQVVQDLLWPDTNCSKVWFFFSFSF